MPTSPKSRSPREIPADKRTLAPIDSILETDSLTRTSPTRSPDGTRRVRPQSETPADLTQSAPVPETAPNGLKILKVPNWQRLGGRQAGWLWHGFSTRKGGVSRAYAREGAAGDLNLGFTAADDRDLVLQNRRLLIEAVTGNPGTPLVTLRQIHSSVLLVGAAEDARQAPREADGLMSAEPGILLGILTADCIPVLVADRKRRVVAAFHAGWRGTVKRIVEAGVGRMRLEFGSQPEDLVAAIGPGIGVCCYAVGEEVLSSFESQFSYSRQLFRGVDDTDEVRRKDPVLLLTQRAPAHSPLGPSLHVDLVEANRRQLLDAGLSAKSIHRTGGCTSCHRDLFFSHRASQGHAGRMMSGIGIRPREHTQRGIH